MLKGCSLCPGPDDSTEDHATYANYVAKLNFYHVLCGLVGQWEGETEVWVHEHFGALIGDVADLSEASTVLVALREANGILIDSVFEGAAARTERNLSYWRDEAAFIGNLDQLAMNAYEDQCAPANPRMPMLDDMKVIMEAAYYGTTFDEVRGGAIKETAPKAAGKKRSAKA